MKYVLDTDICIYWLGGNTSIENQILELGFEDIGTTIITLAELYYGAYKSTKIERNLRNLQKLENEIEIFHTSSEVGKHFGNIKADLERRGEIIEDADILIASIVLSNDSILVTNNSRHFGRIGALQIEDGI